MSEQAKYVLVGGGLTAASAAREIRKNDDTGRLVILAAEDALPYHRPPLSKGYLKGEAERGQLQVQPESWYEKREIEVWRGARVTGLDPEGRLVTLEDGHVLGYERCLIATGGRARTLELPGSRLDGIHTLRDVEDSDGLRQAMAGAESAVVIGASFIGMELASAFADAGVETTVVELAPRVWPKITDEKLAGFFQRYFEERGVRFVLGASLAGFEGQGRVDAARLEDGRRLACDFAAVGVGIVLNLDFLTGTRVRTENGVVVDDRLRASADGLYAAGDVAAYPDPLFDRRIRIEHWDNAKAQGTHAGRNMTGADATYEHMSYFFSDVFDLSLHVVGDLETYDRVLIRGSPEEASFVAFYVRDDVVKAALTVERDWTEVEALKGLIRAGAVVEREDRWTDEAVPLEELEAG